MNLSQFIAACSEVCLQCKLGTPVRYRSDTQEWVHENIRTNDALRITDFSHVYCTATDLRNQHEDVS